MSAHLFIECPCGYFVPVDFRIHRGVTAGLRPARITYPHLQSRGLQIPEDIVVITGTITTLVPVDLQSTGWLIAGLRPARITNPQLQPRGLQIPENKNCDPLRIAYPHLLTRGLQIPEDKFSSRFFAKGRNLINDNTNSRPCGFAIHRVINCGSAPRADSISAFIDSGITNPRGQNYISTISSLGITNPRKQKLQIPEDKRIKR